MVSETIKPLILSSMLLSSSTLAEDKFSFDIKEYLSKYESHIKLVVNNNLKSNNEILGLVIEVEKYKKGDLNYQIISAVNDVKKGIDGLFPKGICCRWKGGKVSIQYTYKF